MRRPRNRRSTRKLKQLGAAYSKRLETHGMREEVIPDLRYLAITKGRQERRAQQISQ